MEPKSLYQIINEDEFRELAQEPFLEFCKLFNKLNNKFASGKEVSKKFYSHLHYEVDSLESFLDDYGARENKRWSFFSEYVASIRNLSLAAFYVRHVLDRYPYYHLLEDSTMDREFKEHAEQTLNFLNSSIYNLFRETLSTGQENGLGVCDETQHLPELSEVISNKRLPRNISEDEMKDESERIVGLCEIIQNASRMMTESNINKTSEPEELKSIVPDQLNEKKIREFLNLIHNVQSEYDTYVKNTKMEQDCEQLKNIRGYISMPLHLLAAALWLSHLYERHEDAIRPGECKRKISMMADKNDLLDKIVNFAYHYALYFLQRGSEISKNILSQYLKTQKITLPIPQPLGFHARPSTYLSLISRQYDSDLFLIVEDEKFNARSVMSMLQAGGIIADKGLQQVVFESDPRVLEDLKILAQNNYCEDKPIPGELAYLRSQQNNS